MGRNLAPGGEPGRSVRVGLDAAGVTEPALSEPQGRDSEDLGRLIPAAQPLLAPSGWLFMKIGHGQRDAVQPMLKSWDAVEFISDLQGIPRIAISRKPGQ